MDDLDRLALRALGGPAGPAAVTGERVVVEPRGCAGNAWARSPAVAHLVRRSPASWSVPVDGPSGRHRGDHRVPAPSRAVPHRDELDLLTLYAGYASSASSATGCSIRSPRATVCWRRSARCSRRWPARSPSPTGCVMALQSLRRGLRADEVGARSAAGADASEAAGGATRPGGERAPRHVGAAARRAAPRS